MKVKSAALFCTLLHAPAWAADPVSALQFQKTCASPVAADQRSCDAYIDSFTNGLIDGQLLANRDVQICPTDELTSAELRTAVAKALQDRPDYLGKDASFAITKGLLDRFRCAPGERYKPAR